MKKTLIAVAAAAALTTSAFAEVTFGGWGALQEAQAKDLFRSNLLMN